MAQFSVHKNKNPHSKTTFPYLVDIQANLLDTLQTRVVVPLSKISSPAKKAISGVTPIVEINGEKYLMLTPQLAGYPARELGPAIATLEHRRADITAALDFLFLGI